MYHWVLFCDKTGCPVVFTVMSQEDMMYGTDGIMPGPWTPLRVLYFAADNKNTLHLKQQTIRTLCIRSTA